MKHEFACEGFFALRPIFSQCCDLIGWWRLA